MLASQLSCAEIAIIEGLVCFEGFNVHIYIFHSYEAPWGLTCPDKSSEQEYPLLSLYCP